MSFQNTVYSYNRFKSNGDIVYSSGGGGGGGSIALPTNQIFVGNASGIATAVAMSGDASITSSGVLTIANAAVTNAKMASASAFTWKGNNTNTTASVSDNSASTLAESGSSVLTLTGANNVLNPTTIQVNQATTSTSGFLSSTDWNTFNSKQTATLANTNILVGNASNVATAVAMSGDATLANNGALTIANSAVTNAKMATMNASTIKGNSSGTTATPQDMNTNQLARIMIPSDAAYFVSPVGSPTNQGRSRADAVSTIFNGFTISTDTNPKIFVAPGNYAELLNSAKTSYTMLGIGQLNSDTLITSLTLTAATGSITYENLAITTLNVQISGVLNLNNCNVTTLNVTAGTGTTILTNCVVGTLTANAATTLTIKNSSITGTTTLSNTGAVYSFRDCSFAQILHNNGTLSLQNCNAVASSNAISCAGTSTASLYNCNFLTASGTPSTISITCPHNINNCVYQALGSVRTGTLQGPTVASTTLFTRAAQSELLSLGASTTTTLTAISQKIVNFTANGSTCLLPVATTLPLGTSYLFYNNGTGTNVIQNSAATTLATLNTTQCLMFTLSNNSTATGTWFAEALQLSANVPYTQQRFTASGTYTAPNNLRYAIFKAIGGGGSGSGTTATLAGQYTVSGSGGNGGYVEVLCSAAQIGASRVFTIGTGGAAPAAGAAGNAGTATTVTGILSAGGGSGGVVSPVNASIQTGTGSAGGTNTITLGVALLNIPGSRGESGMACQMTNGNYAYITTGHSTQFGSYQSRATGPNFATTVPPVPTANTGLASGCTIAISLATAQANVAGATGYLVVDEYY